MTKIDHPAATITAEQLAELKAAFEKATKDRLVVDGISYIDKSVSPPNPVPAYADVWTADPTNGRRLCNLPYADACFFAIAHNLMPALIAAAEEAEESRPWVMFYRDGKTLGEIAAHFETTIYEFSPWLTAPMMRATREAESYAFAAGRKGGIEAAAKIVDGYIGCEAIAAAIRALIEKENANV